MMLSPQIGLIFSSTMHDCQTPPPITIGLLL